MKRSRYCSHLRVDVNGILESFSERTQMRRLRGTCQQCFRDVCRNQTQHEIVTGITQTQWETLFRPANPKHERP